MALVNQIHAVMTLLILCNFLSLQAFGKQCSYSDACNKKAIVALPGSVIVDSCRRVYRVTATCKLRLVGSLRPPSTKRCSFTDPCNNQSIVARAGGFILDSCRKVYRVTKTCRLVRVGTVSPSRRRCSYIDACDGTRISAKAGGILEDSCPKSYFVSDNCKLVLIHKSHRPAASRRPRPSPSDSPTPTPSASPSPSETPKDDGSDKRTANKKGSDGKGGIEILNNDGTTEGSNEGCVEAALLHGAVLQHWRNLWRKVLCGRGLCATPNHAFLYNGRYLSMRQLCRTWQGECTTDWRWVNNLKIAKNVRWPLSIAGGEHISATPYDARFPIVLIWAVQIVEDIAALVLIAVCTAALVAALLFLVANVDFRRDAKRELRGSVAKNSNACIYVHCRRSANNYNFCRQRPLASPICA